MGIGKHHAVLEQVAEAALSHALQKASGQVAAELVYGDLQHEPGRGLDRATLGRPSGRRQRRHPGDREAHDGEMCSQSSVHWLGPSLSLAL
jgi:hypothetical protein